jgi:hypothetical protein
MASLQDGPNPQAKARFNMPSSRLTVYRILTNSVNMYNGIIVNIQAYPNGVREESMQTFPNPTPIQRIRDISDS